jgi:hypothetical protein
VEAVLELGQDAELAERFEVLLAAEGGAHAGQIADRGDLGAQAATERLAGGASQVVVATAGAFRGGNDLQLAGAGLELEYRAVGQVPFERELASVGMAGVEFGEGESEPTEILLPA